MKRWLAFCAVTIIAVVSQAAEFSRAIDIIQKEGQFLFTDGSSYYLFSRDGRFDSGPLSMSGRTIRGTWKQKDDYQFIVEGEWGWMNGVSQLNDNRRLVISVQPSFVYLPRESKNTFLPRHMTVSPKIYKCYFTIEELVKTADKK